METKSKQQSKLARHADDTGSSQVQIAQLTERIESLTGHLKTHAHDHHSRRGLLQMVGKRRRLLDYLKEHDIDSYQAVVKELKIRR